MSFAAEHATGLAVINVHMQLAVADDAFISLRTVGCKIALHLINNTHFT
jgi:hypothetical protein